MNERSHVESAIEAYLDHYGRIAVSDMNKFFGVDIKRRKTASGNLTRRWIAVFSRRGFSTSPKAVSFPGIGKANAFIRQKKLMKLSEPRGKQ